MIEDDDYSAAEDLNIQQKTSPVSSCEMCNRRFKRKGGLNRHMNEDKRKVARKAQVMNWCKRLVSKNYAEYNC